MPKIIVTSRYMRNTPKKTAGNLVKYMATREGVEKVPVGTDVAPSTVRQQRLIKQILKIDSEVEKYPEYQDYLKAPTKNNATEFIDAFIERNADRIGDMKKIVEYMANRPGVEKLTDTDCSRRQTIKLILKRLQMKSVSIRESSGRT